MEPGPCVLGPGRWLENPLGCCSSAPAWGHSGPVGRDAVDRENHCGRASSAFNQEWCSPSVFRVVGYFSRRSAARCRFPRDRARASQHSPYSRMDLSPISSIVFRGEFVIGGARPRHHRARLRRRRWLGGPGSIQNGRFGILQSSERSQSSGVHGVGGRGRLDLRHGGPVRAGAEAAGAGTGHAGLDRHPGRPLTSAGTAGRAENSAIVFALAATLALAAAIMRAGR